MTEIIPKSILSILFLITISLIIPTQSGDVRLETWTKSSVVLPQAGKIVVAGYDPNQIYKDCIFLFNGHGLCGDCVWCYNFTNEEIITFSSNSGDVGFSYGSTITAYITGVYDEGNDRITDYFYWLDRDWGLQRFDILTESYVSLTDYSGFSMNTDSCLVSNPNDKERLYIVDITADVLYIYNISDDSYTTGPSLLWPRTHTMACVFNDHNKDNIPYLYVFGGHSTRIERVNLNTLDEFITMARLMDNIEGSLFNFSASQSISMTSYKNYMFLIGGWDDSINGPRLETFTIELNYNTGSVSSIKMVGKFLEPSGGLGLVLAGPNRNQIYLFGGWNNFIGAYSDIIAYSNPLDTFITTADPTLSPSIDPTSQPSMEPSSKPSNLPSVIPTVQPTSVPGVDNNDQTTSSVPDSAQTTESDSDSSGENIESTESSSGSSDTTQGQGEQPNSIQSTNAKYEKVSASDNNSFIDIDYVIISLIGLIAIFIFIGFIFMYFGFKGLLKQIRLIRMNSIRQHSTDSHLSKKGLVSHTGGGYYTNMGGNNNKHTIQHSGNENELRMNGIITLNNVHSNENLGNSTPISIHGYDQNMFVHSPNSVNSVNNVNGSGGVSPLAIPVAPNVNLNNVNDDNDDGEVAAMPQMPPSAGDDSTDEDDHKDGYAETTGQSGQTKGRKKRRRKVTKGRDRKETNDNDVNGDGNGDEDKDGNGNDLLEIGKSNDDDDEEDDSASKELMYAPQEGGNATNGGE